MPAPLRILLVEDNPAEVHLTREQLSALHPAPTVDVTMSGETVVDDLRTGTTPRPDLVLLDLNLPGRSGHEVLGDLKADASLAKIPVVILSSSSARSDVDAAYAAHANAYLTKPGNLAGYEKLALAIHEFWAESALLP